MDAYPFPQAGWGAAGSLPLPPPRPHCCPDQLVQRRWRGCTSTAVIEPRIFAPSGTSLFAGLNCLPAYNMQYCCQRMSASICWQHLSGSTCCQRTSGSTCSFAVWPQLSSCMLSCVSTNDRAARRCWRPVLLAIPRHGFSGSGQWNPGITLTGGRSF